MSVTDSMTFSSASLSHSPATNFVDHARVRGNGRRSEEELALAELAGRFARVRRERGVERECRWS